MTPNSENGTLPPKRQKNTDRRQREYLTPKEVENLAESARTHGRNGYRDATMIIMAYRHGLRVSELCALRWEQIDFIQRRLYVRRRNNGLPNVHPMQGLAIRALRNLKRLQKERKMASDYVFTIYSGTPITEAGFRKMLARRVQ